MSRRAKSSPEATPYWDPGTARPDPKGGQRVLGEKPKDAAAPVLWPLAPQSDAEAEAEAGFDNMPF